MRRAVLALAWPLCGLASGAASPAEPRAMAELSGRIDQLIKAAGAEASVSLRTLDGKDQLFLRPDAVYHAASTMKVPVMIELFAQAREGRLGLDDPLAVKNTFASIVDGSPYSLDVAEDSEGETYQALGGVLSLRQLCESMITRSGNLATNLLIEKLGVENIRRRVRKLGAQGMNVLRGVEDGKAFQAGLNNTTTARGLMVLLEKIALGRAGDPASSRQMVEVLGRQRFNEAIPAGLPPGTPVAHKTGTITRIHHDGAIVYGPRPFVLVVLVRGIDDEKKSAALIAAIARLSYEAVSDRRSDQMRAR